MKASIKIQGGSKLKSVLDELPKKIQNKILRTAMRNAAKVIAEETKAQAPVLSGVTRAAVKVRAAKRRKGSIGFTVQVGQGSYKGKTFYASFVEFGHYAGSRKLGNKRTFIPPNPFIRRAFLAKKDEAVRVATEGIRQGILDATKS
jgi:HK97 gp10 family phage protein